jgi:choline dehydrogenase-like flavoprotein
LIIGRTSNLTEAKGDRAACQNRNICARGCTYGAYFSTQSSTLPAARATGNLTLLTDKVVDSIIQDPKTGRATGVHVIDAKTRQRSEHHARIVFLCAGSVNSISVLLRSANERNPNGLANSSGVLGRYFMDHALSMSLVAEVPGFTDRTYFGNRANGIIIPRFVNATEQVPGLLRGYSYQGSAFRASWTRATGQAGIGAEFKHANRGPGPWHILLGAFAECLPQAENRVSLAKNKTDSLGIAQTRIDFAYGDNERKLLVHALEEAKKMVALIGGKPVRESVDPGAGGSAVHEMGGARMGRDPATSVLNGRSQAHDVPNLFVTDGAAMASTACQNPSLTYMAFTARAAAYAADQLKTGAL